MNYWKKIISFLENLNFKRFFSQTFKNYWLTIILGILGLLVASYIILVSFWLNLPEDKLRFYIISNIQKNLAPDIHFNFDEAQTSISGLYLRGISIKTPQLGEKAFNFEQAYLGVLSWQLLILKLPFRMTSSGLNIFGHYKILSKQVNIKSDDLLINNIPAIRSTGLLQGVPTFSIAGFWQKDEQYGRLHMTLKSLKLNPDGRLLQPLPFNVPSDIFFFDRIDGTLDLNQDIKRLNLRADGIYQGNVVATANWNNDFLNSDYTIDLNGILQDALVDSTNDLFFLFIKPHLDGNKVNLKLSFSGLFKNFDLQKLN